MSSLPLSEKTLKIVRDTLPAVGAAGSAFTAHFYKRLFDAHPDLLNTFNLNNQREGSQQRALFSAVAASASSVLDHGVLPIKLLEGINHKHCALNVVPAQYDVVGEHILGTITEMLNPGQEVLDAWGELYGVLAGHFVRREEELYRAMESKEGGWRGTRTFIVSEKMPKSATITQLRLSPEDGKPIPTFLPGQYITLWAKEKNWPFRQARHYSLISAPGEAYYTIAVKKEPQGLMSTYLHDGVGVGDKLEMSPPFGNFTMDHCEDLWISEADAPLVLLSAGVGITPMLGMLGSLKNGTVETQNRQVFWLHASKNGTEHAFRDYLVGLARAHGNDLTRRVWYLEPNADDVQGDDNRSPFHFEGLMNLNDVRGLVPFENPKANYFMCGPIPWLKSMKEQLVTLGVEPTRVHFEIFGPASGVEI